MQNELKEFTKYIKFARKHGLKRLKIGEIDFEFSHPQAATIPGKKDTIGGAPLNDSERMPTEDEMLLWSTSAYDDVRADRTASAKENN